jgi:hypothetical protein
MIAYAPDSPHWGEKTNRRGSAMTNQKIAKHIPFLIQLSLIMFLIMVVPCITLMLYSNHTILRLSEGEIANTALSNIEATRRLNENTMTRVC